MNREKKHCRGQRAFSLALLFLLIAPGCGMLRRSSAPIDRSQDDRILQEVQARFASEPALDATQIRVEVDGAIVVLYGSVAGIAAWQCAIRNAQLVSGVITVVDYLLINRGPRELACHAGPNVPPRSAGPQRAAIGVAHRP